MDRQRARSFGAVAAAYAEHRPDYPGAALDWALAPLAGRDLLDLLDLGAGTGKLTGALVGRGAVVAVDPDPAMLAELRARLPEVDAREGSAESIPVPDASVDAVLVGTAWHWFDEDRALPEIARVLRPGGVLAALWHGDDGAVGWVTGLHEAAGYRRTVPNLPPEHVRTAFPPHPAFAPSERTVVPHRVRTTREGLVATLATHSWALVSAPAERDAAFDRIRGYLAGCPDTPASGFALPLVVDVVRAVRLA